MPTRFYQDYNQNTPITSLWLNAINQYVYGATGNNTLTSPLAWIRFNGSTATIVQSNGVLGIVRNSTGNYTITFSQTLTQATNVYSITTNVAGFAVQTAETTNSVTIQLTNTSNTAVDATVVCVTVFGAYAVQF